MKTKGFGFIVEDETERTKYVVHVSGLEDDIEKNDKVTF